MTDELLITVGIGVGGFVIGVLWCYVLLKYRVAVPYRQADHLVLELPLLGRIQTTCRIRHAGIFLEEWEALGDKVRRLGRLLPVTLMLRYARAYGIDYVGLEGDRRDRTWSRGRLAYLERGVNGEHRICLNPALDTEDMAQRLSQQLGEPLQPSEVHAFLFLHEIGHTRQAGNQCYGTALINHALAGGKRSYRKRQELRRLKWQIERFADRFALQELQKWRREAPCNAIWEGDAGASWTAS